MKKYCTSVVYVDDTIFVELDALLLEREIKSIGVKEDQCYHSFQLRDEGGIVDFLEIRIEETKSDLLSIDTNWTD
jgi:hypothetical protein